MALLGTQEIVVIGIILVLLFGATAIPKLARSLGRAKGEFNKARSEFTREAEKAEHEGGAAALSPSEAQVRATARSLGIDDAGKNVGELKALINKKLA